MYASPCACKGIRSCNLCQPSKDHVTNDFQSHTVYIYCDACRQAVRMDVYESNAQCPHHTDIGNNAIAFPLDGIYLVSDFLSESEEASLVDAIDNDVWITSQSGRLKQDFGIKINFKKQTIKTKYFTGMPLYSKPLLDRLQTHRVLRDFQSVELCNLDYSSERGSHIDPHIDDTWIWGERLITINLLSNTILSLMPKEKETTKVIYIPLPRRWMLVLYGDARYEYKHAIQRQHIQARRLAVTFRELTGTHEKFYEENKDLYERIIRIGKRFTGITVGRFEKLVSDVTARTAANGEAEISSPLGDQFKDLFESAYQTPISSLEKLHSSMYLANADKKYLVKLVSPSSLSHEQLQSILSSSNLDGSILDQTCVISLDQDRLTANQQVARFLAQWRLATSAHSQQAFDHDWFNDQYASIIHKKKNSYPLLLSNLFTCEQQLSTQLETGGQQSSPLFDLAAACLINIPSFNDNVQEIVRAYEEIVPLTDEEVNQLDAFVRLQLVLLINNTDIDDDKQLDLLEQLSFNLAFVRNLVR